MKSIHIPVLSKEIVDYLTSIAPKDHVPVYVDGTLGGGGHALLIAKALKGKVTVIGMDRDMEAVNRAKTTLLPALNDNENSLILECNNFRNLDTVLDKHGVKNVDMILLDLGISSDELDNSGRGFSFQKDEPLYMTMGDPKTHPFTALDIVNGWEEDDIANVIFAYGEERYARRIAKAIVVYRQKKAIETSMELAEIVKGGVPVLYRRGKIHPATKTFQALRIAVNDELASIKEGIAKAYFRLNEGGRMAVISFHSLEDRIVKDFFKKQAKDGAIISKKPLRPSAEEVATNPRSRSAKLRFIEKR